MMQGTMGNVALTSTQVALAKRLGIPTEVYARDWLSVALGGDGWAMNEMYSDWMNNGWEREHSGFGMADVKAEGTRVRWDWGKSMIKWR